MTVHTTTRGWKSAQAIANAIADREDFVTGGALSGQNLPRADVYVVLSYEEPIVVIRYEEDRTVATVSIYHHSATTTNHRQHVVGALLTDGSDVLIENVVDHRINAYGEAL